MFDERSTGSNYLSKLTLSRNRMLAELTDWRVQLQSVLDTKGIYVHACEAALFEIMIYTSHSILLGVLKLQFTLVTRYFGGNEIRFLLGTLILLG
jgi:hypothetical protein